MPEVSYRALVVEDDPDAAQFVETILERRAGMEVVVAGDADSALEALAAGPFDLIVSDIELPGQSGLQMLPQAKKLAPGVPVIVITAHGSLDYAVEALRNDVDEFLLKPISVADLVERATTLANEGRVRRAEAAPSSVLAVGAHPDDVEIGVGGTLAAHSNAGDRLTILTLSRGAVGGEIEVRRREARAAAEIIGAQLVHLDFHDTFLDPASGVTTAVENVIADVNPDRIYTHTRSDRHQDHRAVHDAVQIAARKVPNLACYQSPSTSIDFRPNRFVDIEPFLDTKLRMLAAYTSQGHRDYMAADLMRATARYWSRFGGGRYVEPLETIRASVKFPGAPPAGQLAHGHAGGPEG
jgi:LmbE family N-acetylglucosaminyl deacetylase/CheY-like chemotaxis protein